MAKLKRILILVMTAALLLSMVSLAVAEDLGEKPVLKFLVYHRTFDPNEDLAVKFMEELSGYDVVYEMLPQDNADEKLMMELSAGTDFDILELYPAIFGRLSDLGILAPLDDALAKYGQTLLAAHSQTLWDASKNANGEIVALVRQVGGPAYGTAKGTRSNGALYTKPEIIEELKLELPKTLDEFTAFLQAIKDAKGVAPLTFNKGTWLVRDIMTAFSLPNIVWIEDESGIENIIEKPAYREYIRYMASLYEKGLLDPDYPVNSSENRNQKFTTDGAYVSQYAFWDIPSLITGLTASGLSTDLVPFREPLADANGKYVLVNSYGVNKYYAIPRTSKNVEHVVNYFNILAEPENFIITHIGKEGEHYTVDENGDYWPIFPAFNDLNWANQFSSLQPVDVEYKQWQARARKTPEMAVAYDAVGDTLPNAICQIDRTSLCNSLPEVQAHSQVLGTMLYDFSLQAIVENKTTDKDFDDFTARYMAEGGQAIKDAMNKWVSENPFDF